MTIPPSARLSFRLLDPASADDIECLYALDQDPQVMHFINGGIATSRQQLQEVMLPRLASYTNPDKGWGMWGVFERASKAFIGWILVRPMHFFSAEPQWQNLELGWRFMQPYWGRGYATEAAAQVMAQLQKNTDVQVFSAIAVAENTASIAIMKKLGMQYLSSGLHRDPLGDMQVETYQLKAVQH
ncbi:GNAT family N-acetyltransferase [Alteromonas flava]|uniref:GNAT family N-acetyltransferase n=1 Tax=Alteromonas flava TaxID=2048003 RepID=UPI000C281320|nr:GNAT family N-acetyltransferase [Alteromonas flava]